MNDSAFHFQSLTPDLVHDAITQVGLYPESGLQPLNSYENRVYLFQSEDRQRYVIKFYRPNRWTPEQIHDEHALAFHLAAHEIPVIAPQRFDAESVFHIGQYQYALWRYEPGRPVELDNHNQLYDVGVELGRWHSTVSSFELSHRLAFTHDNKVHQQIAYLLAQNPWPESTKDKWHALLHSLDSKLEQPSLFNAAKIALHGDCHAGNILWRDQPSFVDLDDCFMGPAVQDLWMLLSGSEQEQRQQLDTILEGYESSTSFDARQLNYIDALRTIRLLNYVVWLHQRWADPAFQQAFPWFAQPEYWKQQLQTFNEQLQKLESGTNYSLSFNY